MKIRILGLIHALIFASVTYASPKRFLPKLFSEVGFLGRNLAMHVEMFPKDLSHEASFYTDKKILFIPGGPSSVKSELVDDLGVQEDNVLMCDLAYPEGGDVEVNADYLEEKIFSAKKRFKFLYYIGEKVNWNFIDSSAQYLGMSDLRERRENFNRYMKELEENNKRFLRDYKEHSDWMIHGDITDLPQEVRAQKYNLIISSNLLHLYNHVLDVESHFKAYEQMSSLLAPEGKLLVFPVSNLMGGQDKILEKVIRKLESQGFKVDLVLSDAPKTNEYYKKLLKLEFKPAFYLRVTAPK